MTFKDYEEKARSTAIYKGIGEWEGIIYNILKLSGEVGEVSDKIGKIFGKGDKPNSLQKEDLKLELGDNFWHLTNLVLDLGFTLEEVLEANNSKLQSRKERNVIVGEGDNR